MIQPTLLLICDLLTVDNQITLQHKSCENISQLLLQILATGVIEALITGARFILHQNMMYFRLPGAQFRHGKNVYIKISEIN